METAERPRTAAEQIGALQQETQLLRQIIHTQDLLNTTRDLQHSMDLVTSRAQELTGASGAVLELVEGDEMVYRSVSGAAEAHLGLRLDIASSLSGQCVRSGMVLTCDDTETDERVDRATCRRIGVRSMIVTPLANARGCEGVLEVLSDRPGAFGPPEVETLQAVASFIANSLRNARHYEIAARAARHDGLTGLINRGSFLEYLEQALAAGDWAGTDAGLLFIDLDGFKLVNDTHGHTTGDEVLHALARRMSGCMRGADILARVGGDEFVVLVNIGSDADLEGLALRLRRIIAEPLHAAGVELLLDASIGFTRAVAGDTAAAMLSRADLEMYSVKRLRAAGTP